MSESDIELIRMKWCMLLNLPQQLSQVDVDESPYFNDFMLRIVQTEYRNRHQPELQIPEGPWQMFKATYFPRWLLRWLPVRYTVYRASQFFPEYIPLSLGFREYHFSKDPVTATAKGE